MVSERALSLVDEAEYALAQNNLDGLRNEILETRSLLDAHRIYALISGLEEALKKYHGTTFDVWHKVTSVRIEAERHMGELLSQLPRSPGERTDLGTADTLTYTQSLQQMGIQKDTARRWQWLAQVPEMGFRFSLEYTRDKGLIPTRGSILKWGPRGAKPGGLLDKLADEAVRGSWPNIKEARQLLWATLQREYGWVAQQWVDSSISRAVAGRLFREVEARIYTGDLDANQARAQVREFAGGIVVDAAVWPIVDQAISKAAPDAYPGFGADHQGPAQTPYPGAVPNEPRAVKTYAVVDPRLHQKLSVLGQLPPNLDPHEFAVSLRDARDADRFESWRQRIQEARDWLNEVLIQWEGEA